MSAVILGFGSVTALGDSAEATFAALRAGTNGIQPIRRFDARTFPVRFGAEVLWAAPGGGWMDGPPLYDAITDACLAESLRGVDLSGVPAARIGVWMGCEAVRPDLLQIVAQWESTTLPDPADLARYHPARQAQRIAHAVGAAGPVHTLSIACTSSAQALGDAMHAIRRGEVDVAIAGGVDVLVHPLMILGFSRLGALSVRNDDPTRASRPFELRRDGFVLGDGGGIVVLAREGLAERLGTPLGRLTGYASTCNAWRITDTPPDGRGTRQAMVLALQDAGRVAGDLGYINAHGTSTPQNDAGEAIAIRAALGSHVGDVPVSSTKSMTGHTVAACGAIEAIVTLQALRDGVGPPTLNLAEPDPDCAIRHIANRAEPITGRIGLSNSAGFGGSNAALVVELP